MKARTVEWVACEGPLICGHGVEFHHCNVPQSPVGFIHGFSWLNEPERAARVSLLTRPPWGWKGTPEEWASLLEEVRAAVTAHLGSGGRSLTGAGRIQTRANG